MRGFSCVAFTEYLLGEEPLLDYANLLSPKNYRKNEKMINKYYW